METITQFTGLAQNVSLGLTANPKFLSSKYFYNDEGSRIFQEIMRMHEYYLTDCELEIFETQKQQILAAFGGMNKKFDLVELGAGDGMKTKVLLNYFLDKNISFNYLPIDISEIAVINLVHELKNEFPMLNVIGKVGDYFHMMNELSQSDNTPKVLLFLGSNIGNFNHMESVLFLKQLKAVMNPDDLLFIGFDLKKDPEIILNAYNDPHGYTASFNLNLLQRINEELGANFEIPNFKHQEVYDPLTGTAKSYLISRKQQKVTIAELDLEIDFESGETIYTEMSQKYDRLMIESMAKESGFEIVRNFSDSRQYFMNALWKLKK